MCSNEPSGLVEHDPLVVRPEAQRVANVVRCPALDIAKDDHLPQTFRHLRNRRACLLQRIRVVDTGANGYPGDRWSRPVTRRHGIVGGKEPIGRERWLHLNCRRGNGPQ
jgi:hypothetical protein